MSVGTQSVVACLLLGSLFASAPASADGVDELPLVVLYDDFDDGEIDWSKWRSYSGVAEANGGGEEIPGGKGLIFWGGTSRSALTQPLDVATGGTVRFWFTEFWVPQVVYWDPPACGGTMDRPEASESLVLQYGHLGYYTWKTIWSADPAAVDVPDADNPASVGAWVSVPLPPDAWTVDTVLRWSEIGADGSCKDMWEIDNVLVVTGPPAVASVNPSGDAACKYGHETDWDYTCVAASAAGNASCETSSPWNDPLFCAAVAPTGEATCKARFGVQYVTEARCVAVSGTGAADCDAHSFHFRCAAVSAFGEAHCTSAGSIYWNHRCYAVSGTGDASAPDRSGTAISGTGDATAEGWMGIAVSGTGHASGPTRASPCDGARIMKLESTEEAANATWESGLEVDAWGVDVVQDGPAVPACEWVEWLDGALGNAGSP